jgi:hypothetical protein
VPPTKPEAQGQSVPATAWARGPQEGRAAPSAVRKPARHAGAPGQGTARPWGGQGQGTRESGPQRADVKGHSQKQRNSVSTHMP